MKESTRLRSRYRVQVVLAAGWLFLASGAPAQETPSAERLEDCESRLLDLVKILEDKKQLAGKKYLYSGPPLGAEHSKCRIVGRRRPSPQYSMYRSNDNINVVVEQVAQGKPPVLYGPFATAYRK